MQNETVLYMTALVYKVLKRRSEEKVGEYVFQNRKGGSRGYASKSVTKALKRAGLHDCTVHTLRHTLASRLVQTHLEQRHVSVKERDIIDSLSKRSIHIDTGLRRSDSRLR